MLSRLPYNNNETIIDFHVLLHDHDSIKHESSHKFPSREFSASFAKKSLRKNRPRVALPPRAPQTSREGTVLGG